MGNFIKGAADADDSTKVASASPPPATANGIRPSTLHMGILLECEDDFHKKYIELEVLGQGAMGRVSRVQLREDEETKDGSSHHHGTSERRKQGKIDYALKSILLDRVDPEKDNSDLEGLKNEIAILKGMDHPNILKAHEVYINREQIYLILELCSGGDLLSRFPYTEAKAANIVSKLCSALKYMHDHAIVHRDLKLENIMFESPDPHAEIKVIDFGLSKKFGNHKLDVIYGGVGSLSTMSPQVIQGMYTSQADLWAVGVITFMLLSSNRPFYHRDPKIMIAKIMEGKYSVTTVSWRKISTDAKDFVSKLLVIDPDERMNAKQALKHQWLTKKEFIRSDSLPDPTAEEQVNDSLIQFKDATKLKKIALNVIAHKSGTKEILELRKVFDHYDQAHDGVISYQEFQNALEKSHLPEKEVYDIFQSIDVNHNGKLNYTEFIAAALEAQGHIEEERIGEAFDRLDADSSGFISRKSLIEFLGQTATEQEITDLIQPNDIKGDGQISWEEFLQMFRKDRTELLDDVYRTPTTSVRTVQEDKYLDVLADEVMSSVTTGPFVKALLELEEEKSKMSMKDMPDPSIVAKKRYSNGKENINDR